MTHNEAKQIKQACLESILQALPIYRDKLVSIDQRLLDYITDCTDPTTDHANLYELLGIRKFLRMLGTYDFATEKVKKIYTAYENLKFSGINGKQSYRLTPMQTFQLAAPFGFVTYDEIGPKRVCTEANYFVPRKSSKTTLAAFFQFWFFFFEDANSQGFCVSNSASQSKILYDLALDLIRQMDRNGDLIRYTATETTWRDHSIHESKMIALSAGGKTKDGLFAQLCCADEYGSAGYVKDKSDMANLVNVVEGSMGPRREPMTVITTTAGRVQEGPYQIKLRGIQASLLLELTVPLDGKPHPMDSDWQFALICCPDIWEEDDESLQQPNVWRKVNRHIGVTVQPDFYEREWQKMLADPEKKKEQITKLFNVWQSARVKQWLTGDRIRPLQRPKRIEDCKLDDGWTVFVGLDFSHGDDLFAVSYLGVNYRSDRPMAGRFFADCECWVLEATMDESPNRALYELWASQGWLHVCPGEVFNSSYAIARLAEKTQSGINFAMFGYDPAQSQQPINDLKAWLSSLGIDANGVKQMVVPVSQTSMTQNPRIAELEAMIKSPEGWMEFSENPMWPWVFGNVAEETTTNDLRRLIKGGPRPTHKIDPVHALMDALYCFDLSEGRIEK